MCPQGRDGDLYIYDETDQGTLYLDFFEGLHDMEFEELNEYTIALTKVVLAFTGLEVYCTDARIYWFVPENERLHVEKELPCLPGETTFYIQKQIRSGLEGQGFNRISSTYAFHNVFFLQWLLNGKKLSQFKYATVGESATGGIGTILAFTSGLKRRSGDLA